MVIPGQRTTVQLSGDRATVSNAPATACRVRGQQPSFIQQTHAAAPRERPSRRLQEDVRAQPDVAQAAVPLHARGDLLGRGGGAFEGTGAAAVAEGVDDDLVVGDEVVHQVGVEGVTGAQRHPVHPLLRHPGEVLDHRAHQVPAEDQIGDDLMPQARVGPEDHHPHGTDAISGGGRSRTGLAPCRCGQAVVNEAGLMTENLRGKLSWPAVRLRPILGGRPRRIPCATGATNRPGSHCFGAGGQWPHWCGSRGRDPPKRWRVNVG